MDPQPLPVQPLSYESTADNSWRTAARIIVLGALAMGTIELVLGAISAAYWYSDDGTKPFRTKFGMVYELTLCLLHLAIAVAAFACLRARPYAWLSLVLSFLGLWLVRELHILEIMLSNGWSKPPRSDFFWNLLSILTVSFIPAFFLALLTRPNIKRVLQEQRG